MTVDEVLLDGETMYIVNPRKWAIKNEYCPHQKFGRDEFMCDDCPDSCPLYEPNDPKNR